MRRLVPLLLGVFLVLAGGAASAQTLEALMLQLPEGDFGDRAEVVAAIGATGDERAAAVLEALQEGDLHARKQDGAIIRVTGRGSKALGFDPEDLPVLFDEPDLQVTRWGTVRIDWQTMMTRMDGVFAGGDIVRGASLVVWGVRDGRDAAAGIHAHLQARAPALALAS